MTRRKNISRQTRIALAVLAEQPSAWRYGYDLTKETGIVSGTLYPMLMRLHDQQLLESEWRPSPHEGRPPRHAYRLTAAGALLAREIAGTDEGQIGRLGGASA